MPVRDGITIGEMIASGLQARAMCTGCNAFRDVNLVRLVAKVGLDYSLFNRRCRCRITKGCPGWNRFFMGPPFIRMMRDDATNARWLDQHGAAASNGF